MRSNDYVDQQSDQYYQCFTHKTICTEDNTVSKED